MADVSIRKLDDMVVEALRQRARVHKRSLEEELRQTLYDSIFQPQRDFAKEMESFHKEMRAKYGVFSDSTPLIRQERDEM